MPPRKKPNSIDADALRSWKLKGARSPVLDARLAWTEVEGTARYVRMMRDVSRVFPTMLPTQASGRWSTTDPPLVTFPPDCIAPECPLQETDSEHGPRSPECWSARDLVGPDPGWWWLKMDLDAIEAKVAAADAGDTQDLEAFAKGWDLHTITTCHAYQHALPPVLTKACHTDPSCEAWRASWDPPWSGDEDRRRHLMKTLRYATQFCISARGVLQAKDIEKLGMAPEELVRFATVYLRTRPLLTARKEKVWAECAKTQKSYTWLGRRRLLYGSWEDRAKEGWAHRISGTVTDMVNAAIIAVGNAFSTSRLVLNTHDGFLFAFEEALTVTEVLSRVRPLVERLWESPTGHAITSTASWAWVDADQVWHKL